MDPGVAGGVEGDPDRVLDAPGADLVVADQAGEDRQPGCVGRGVAVGAQRRRAQVPDHARVGLPALRMPVGEGAVELVELAPGSVIGEHVAIAVGAAASLDRRAERDPVLAVVGLRSVGGEPNLDLALALADHSIGEPVLARRAEVGMEHVAAVGVDVGDDLVRARVDGRVGDVLVPGTLVGERSRRRPGLGARPREHLALRAQRRVRAELRRIGDGSEERGRGRNGDREGDRTPDRPRLARTSVSA